MNIGIPLPAESSQRMSFHSPSPSTHVEVTPDLQAYAAGKNFRSDIRGEDKLEGSPILTNKGQRALESFRRMADVDGPSQGRQKIQRTTAADEINPHNLNVPSVYTDGANVNTEDSLSPSTNNNNIPGPGIPLVSQLIGDATGEHDNSTNFDDIDDVSTNHIDSQAKSSLLNALVGNTEDYSGSKHSHMK